MPDIERSADSPLGAESVSAVPAEPRHWTVYVCPKCDRIFKQARDKPAASGSCHHGGEPVQPEEVLVDEADHLRAASVIAENAASYVGSAAGRLAHLSDGGTATEGEWERAQAAARLMHKAAEILSYRSKPC